MLKPKRKSKDNRWHGGGCVDFCFCHTPRPLVATYSRLAMSLQPTAKVKAEVEATLKNIPDNFIGVYWRPPGMRTPHWARGGLAEKMPAITVLVDALRTICSGEGFVEGCAPIFLAVRAHNPVLLKITTDSRR